MKSTTFHSQTCEKAYRRFAEFVAKVIQTRNFGMPSQGMRQPIQLTLVNKCHRNLRCAALSEDQNLSPAQRAMQERIKRAKEYKYVPKFFHPCALTPWHFAQSGIHESYYGGKYVCARITKEVTPPPSSGPTPASSPPRGDREVPEASRAANDEYNRGLAAYGEAVAKKQQGTFEAALKDAQGKAGEQVSPQ